MVFHHAHELMQYLRVLCWRSRQTWWRRWLKQAFFSGWMTDNKEPKLPLFTEFSVPIREHERDRPVVVAMFQINDDDPRSGKIVVTEHVQEY